MTKKYTKNGRCLFIVGPTASGKTWLSLELARFLSAEIISADSRQIYRNMNIGTATPSDEELAQTPHYFINEKDPDEAYSAGRFGEEARRLIEERCRNGENMIVCGGSGLYVQAVLGMIDHSAESRPELRRELLREYEEFGLDPLVKRLQKISPERAARVDLSNPQRVIRSLELRDKELASREISLDCPYLIIGLAPERQFLYERINERVLRMVEAGLTDEVRALSQRGYTRDLNALNTVGYKEILDHLNGKCSLEEAIENIQKNTRHFAKRQFTWFRKYGPPEKNWIHFDAETSAEDILAAAVSIIEDEPGWVQPE